MRNFLHSVSCLIWPGSISARFYITLLLSFSFLLGNLSFTYPPSPEEMSVRSAYELRMKGKINEAVAMLNKMVEAGGADGMVYYERARARMACMKGGMDVSIDDVIKDAGMAVQSEPRNAAFRFFEADCLFLKAYISMESDTASVKKDIAGAIESYERLLELKPDYHEARMVLVEIYRQVPGELGGDRNKARAHVKYLKKKDWFFGKQAGEIMLPYEASRLDYWETVYKKNKHDPRVKKQLAMALFAEGKPDEAKIYLDEVVAEDPASCTLILEKANYHMMQVMQGKGDTEVELALAIRYVREYLSFDPPPPAPLQAYALGNLAKINFFRGNRDAGEKYLSEATGMDPVFCRAFSVPNLLLYLPPGELYRSSDYSSFLRPF